VGGVPRSLALMTARIWPGVMTQQILRKNLIAALLEIREALVRRHRNGNPCPEMLRLMDHWLDVADPRVEWRRDPGP
jgi:hypothetical protein